MAELLANAVFGVKYGNGVWVIVGAAGSMATATDPTSTWTSRTSSYGTTDIFGVDYNGGYGGSNVWLTVGSTKMATASDPTSTWTQQTVPAKAAAVVNQTPIYPGWCGAKFGWAVACDATLPNLPGNITQVRQAVKRATNW